MPFLKIRHLRGCATFLNIKITLLMYVLHANYTSVSLFKASRVLSEPKVFVESLIIRGRSLPSGLSALKSGHVMQTATKLGAVGHGKD